MSKVLDFWAFLFLVSVLAMAVGYWEVVLGLALVGAVLAAMIAITVSEAREERKKAAKMACRGPGSGKSGKWTWESQKGWVEKVKK